MRLLMATAGLALAVAAAAPAGQAATAVSTTPHDGVEVLNDALERDCLPVSVIIGTTPPYATPKIWWECVENLLEPDGTQESQPSEGNTTEAP